MSDVLVAIKRAFDQTGRWPQPKEWTDLAGFPVVPAVRCTFLKRPNAFIVDHGFPLKRVCDSFGMLYSWIDRTGCLTLYAEHDVTVSVAMTVTKMFDDVIDDIESDRRSAADAIHALWTDVHTRDFLICSAAETRFLFLDFVKSITWLRPSETIDTESWTKALIDDDDVYLPKYLLRA